MAGRGGDPGTEVGERLAMVDENVAGGCFSISFLKCLQVYSCRNMTRCSFNQDSELSYAHRDGRLLELVDEAWEKDKLPNDGVLFIIEFSSYRISEYAN